MKRPVYKNLQLLRLHWRRGTLTYLLALLIIGVLALLSHYLVQSIVNQQEASARVVNLAGRQRMLSQRITLFAGQLLAEKRNQSITLYPGEYLDAIATMKKVHQGLMHGSLSLEIPAPESAAIHKIFTSPPINLDQRLQAFFQLADSIVDESLPLTARQQAYQALSTMARYDILNALDALVLQFQKDSEAAIAKLQQYNRLSLMGMLLTLLLEALFIFRPLLLSLYRREKQYLLLLRKMDAEIAHRVSFQTFNDPLTGLPNRISMLEKIQTCIMLAQQNGSSLVVISVGLDRFKDINNSLGHDKGDELLIGIGERLQGLVQQYHGFLGRITGDEFAIVLDQRKENLELVQLMRQLLQSIAEPFEGESFCIHVTASLGLACYADDGANARSLLMHANQAMRIAKDEGGSCFRFFQPIMTSKMTRRIKLDQELRLAMSDCAQLMLFYQPKVDLRDGRIAGVEALLRWHHPQQGMISPAEFIPIAEDSGLIVELGDWVLVRAFEQMSWWQQQGFTVDVAINISAKQLLRRNISERVLSLTQQLDVDPRHVQLEITENNLMDNMSRILPQLQALQQHGFTLAIDDFGTGHSSLSRLRDLPVKVLKIDRSFVINALRDQKDEQLVEAIIGIGHTLNRTIIAEGIETPEQMALLQQLGCEEGQGFLFAKPMSAEQLEALLHKGRIDLSSKEEMA
ncbi:EAL domain-containing protein [Shewanella sp. A32]|uniref:putative bifunctional diguanylate cyclase/phosphodiesterase n=1 Tax=Shewanella sp. A32 TaxID=3031327 RepID=UPI0023B8D2D7|nr:EAL domain-containing protein [Shewanella sp. A32]MDF0533417.1 EAL domain-containing protein [Shewanella sp. A32]